MSTSKSILNFMYFHRRRIIVAGTFCTTYGVSCALSTKSPNEIFRMGIAGSVANLIVESAFHFADTVNVRAKLSDKGESSLHMVRRIYAKEGLYGFSRGFSACFYGSAICGFLYFSLYKVFK
jgi:hypothetical protein